MPRGESGGQEALNVRMQLFFFQKVLCQLQLLQKILICVCGNVTSEEHLSLCRRGMAHRDPSHLVRDLSSIISATKSDGGWMIDAKMSATVAEGVDVVWSSSKVGYEHIRQDRCGLLSSSAKGGIAEKARKAAARSQLRGAPHHVKALT